MPEQTGDQWVRLPVLLQAAVLPEFAIAAITYTCPLAVIPDKTTLVVGYRPVAFGIIITAPSAISRRPRLLEVIRSIRAHTPVVSIGAHLRVDIEIIEQHKLSYQRVLIRRNPPAKQHKARI